MKKLIERVTVWDGDSAILENGALLIDNGRIEAVLTPEELATHDPPSDVEQINGAGKLAIPGLINAHTHLYSSLARGMSLPETAPTSFTEILEQLWWRLDRALDEQSIRMSGLIGAMEAARCGITTLIDHHASPYNVTNSLSVLREAVCEDVGLRGLFCYEVSDRDGAAIAAAGIDENLRFLASHEAQDLMSSGLFGLHASFTLSDKTLARVASSLPEKVGVHIHVAEGPEDEEQCIAEHGIRIAMRLDRFGLLRPNSILVHCLHLDEAERDLIAERDAIVVHNPRSNMNNAVGVFDLDGFLNKGLLVGLGTDGLGGNLLSELFTAGILQKVSTGAPLAAGFGDLKRLLFDNNPLILGRLLGVKIGRIAPGYPADIALLDYHPPTPLSGDTVFGHLLFGPAVHALRVSDLFVAGNEVLRNGVFTGLDEERIYAQAREEAARLWGRAA